MCPADDEIFKNLYLQSNRPHFGQVSSHTLSRIRKEIYLLFFYENNCETVSIQRGIHQLAFSFEQLLGEVCEREKEPIGFSPIESTCLTKGAQ